jgi:predicted O-methyltransferase YrrM
VPLSSNPWKSFLSFLYRQTVGATARRSRGPTRPEHHGPPDVNLLHESIRATQSLDGWCSLEKAQALADLVLAARPACIVEIGVFGGRSLIPMALAARTYGGRVHGVDPWSKEAALEGEPDGENRDWWSQIDIEGVYDRFLIGVRRFGVQDTVRVHRAPDTTAIREFAAGQIGILHVDGNHSAEVSRRYIEQWGPKITAGGYLIMDDIDWRSQAETIKLIESVYEPVRRDKSWAIYRKPVPAVESRPPAAA